MINNIIKGSKNVLWGDKGQAMMRDKRRKVRGGGAEGYTFQKRGRTGREEERKYIWLLIKEKIQRPAKNMS